MEPKLIKSDLRGEHSKRKEKKNTYGALRGMHISPPFDYQTYNNLVKIPRHYLN